MLGSSLVLVTRRSYTHTGLQATLGEDTCLKTKQSNKSKRRVELKVAEWLVKCLSSME